MLRSNDAVVLADGFTDHDPPDLLLGDFVNVTVAKHEGKDARDAAHLLLLRLVGRLLVVVVRRVPVGEESYQKRYVVCLCSECNKRTIPKARRGYVAATRVAVCWLPLQQRTLQLEGGAIQPPTQQYTKRQKVEHPQQCK